jgi:hypothetical protein
VARGQAPEEPELPPLRSLPANNPTPAIPPMPAMPPAPALLALPPPEQLGIAAARPPENDLARLEQLGASCFRLERTSAGGTRVTCMVPSNQPGRQRRFEVEAASQAEAVRLVLDQAEAWTKAKQ